MKTVMILGGSASEVPVIRRALEMGHKVVLVDRDDKSPGFKEDVIAEHHSIADKDKVLELAQKHNIDGILASVDAGVRPTLYMYQNVLPYIFVNVLIKPHLEIYSLCRLARDQSRIPVRA